MGVSINAYYSQVKLPNSPTNLTEEEIEDFEVKYWDRAVFAYPQYKENFPRSFQGLEVDTWYSTKTPKFEILSTPYGSYNKWRETLAAWQNLTPRDFWDSDKFNDYPFAELIDFSDCDGMIGPIAMRNLVGDFRRNRDAYNLYLRNSVSTYDQQYFTKYYENFMISLNRCKNGFIVFS